MPIDQNKLDAYMAWKSAAAEYEASMRAIIEGRADYDHENMRRLAAELGSLFATFREAWHLGEERPRLA